MIINHNNKIFTNDSNKASNETTFIISKQNEQYVNQAKKNGCTDFIQSSELKNFFDFSSIKVIGITGTNGKTTTAAANLFYSFRFRI